MRPPMKSMSWTVAVVLAAAWGFLSPAAGRTLNDTAWSLPALGAVKFPLVLVGIIMGLSGLSLPLDALSRNLRSPGAFFVALAVTYVAYPLAGYGLGLLFFPGELAGPERRHTLEGLMLLAAQTSTVATGIVLTTLAGGDRALAILITVANYAASLLATPAILRISLGGDARVPAGAIAATLLAYVLLPLVLGQAIRRAAPGRVRGRERRLTPISQVIILVFVLMATAKGSERLPGHAAGYLLRLSLYATVLHAAMFAVGLVLGTLGARDRGAALAATFCAASKTLTSGTAIWNEHFRRDNPEGILPLAVYHIVQIVAGSLVVPWAARRGLPPPPAPPSPPPGPAGIIPRPEERRR